MKPYAPARPRDSPGGRLRGAGGGERARHALPLRPAGPLSAPRLLPLLALLTLGAAGCATAGAEGGAGPRAERLARQVAITRDEWGIPHIDGESDASVAFGVAYAMAEDNYWQIEEDYLTDLGRAAHWYGEQRLADDLVRAALGVEREARLEYAAEPEARRRIWDGFADGLNYWLERHPSTPRRIITRYEPWMVLARHREGHAGDSIGPVSLRGYAPPAAPIAGPRRPRVDDASRAWAIAPGRSASGKALLIASRSAPYFGRGQLYELHLRSDTGWEVAGTALLGTPVPTSGHNRHHAWTHVRGVAQAGVRPVLFDHPADSLAYRTAAGWRTATLAHDTVHVNTAAGVVARPVTFLRTELGPVLARRGDTAYVAAPGGPGAGGALQREYALGRATSLAEFRAVLAAGARTTLATLYADTAGNIMYVAPAIEGEGVDEVLNPASGALAACSGGAPASEPADAGSACARALLPAAGAVGVEAAARLPFEGRAAGSSERIAQLVHEWEQVGGSNPRRAASLDAAIDLLRDWDGAVTGESRAATLYFRWREHEARVAAGSYAALRALEEALAQLRREWQEDAVPLGEVSRLARTHTSGTGLFRDDAISLPLAAAPANDAGALVAESERGSGRLRFARSGSAWISVIELAAPPRVRAIAALGQSANPASSHFFDQAAWFVRGALRDAWFEPADVTGHARERYLPGNESRAGGETTSPGRT